MLLKLFRPETPAVRRPAVSEAYLAGDRIFLRPPEKDDGAAWIALKNSNHEFLKPWSPAQAMININPAGYTNRLRCYREDWGNDRAYAFFIFLPSEPGEKGPGELIGGLTLGNVVRGAAQAAVLGYWMDKDRTRQGYMTEAVLLACHFAFRGLKLHRVEAGTLPENAASQKVLNNCGFMLEGSRRKYLKIAGEWRDHLVFSLLSDEFISLGGPAGLT
jgi:ribosomal-protein-alanine N-acetyltransferase